MKKIIVTIVLCLAFCKVNAMSSIEKEIIENGRYVNEVGVVITKENYNKIKNVMTEIEIKNIDEKYYEFIDSSDKIVASKSAIIEKVYYEVGEDKFLIEENVLTEDEFAARIIQKRSSYNDAHTTDYKHIRLIVTGDNGAYSFYMQNSWKVSPANKSFDVIAMRWEGNDITKDNSSALGSQTYKQTTSEVNPPEILYNSTSSNFKFATKGVGLSQNLVDSGKYFTSTLDISVRCSGNINVFGTYQHAQGTLTLAQSQSYSFSSSGLGNVLYYSNSTIRNIYDNTAGLSLSFAC